MRFSNRSILSEKGNDIENDIEALEGEGRFRRAVEKSVALVIDSYR